MTDTMSRMSIGKMAVMYLVLTMTINIVILGYLASNDSDLETGNETLIGVYLVQGMGELTEQDKILGVMTSTPSTFITQNRTSETNNLETWLTNNEGFGFVSDIIDLSLNLLAGIKVALNIITVATPFIIFEALAYIDNPVIILVAELLVALQSIVIVLLITRFVAERGKSN